MASDLTGDYDVVAAFSIGAVNRILAAMHRGNRLPHSLSMAVSDFPNFGFRASAVSVVDKFGEAIADVNQVKRVAYAAATTSGTLSQEVIRNVDPVVNWRPDPSGPQEIRFPDPSQSISETGFGGIGVVQNSAFISGVAQLQLGPPTMQLQRNRADSADVHTPVMIRYIGNPGTRVLSDFMRGEIVTTFGVKHVASAAGTNIVVDVTGSEGNVHFNSAWSAVGLDPSDITAIDQTLTRSLKNSFQPSSTPLPSGFRKLDFKGMAAQNAVAVMMNISSINTPSPDSVGSVDLAPDDQFSMAVDGNAITGPFAARVNAAILHSVQNPDVEFQFKFGIGPFQVTVVDCVVHSAVSVGTATVTLVPDINAGPVHIPGSLILTIPAHVNIWWDNKPDVVSIPDSFDVTLAQAFVLTVAGREVGIDTSGGLAINFSGTTTITLAGVTVSDLKDEAKAQITALFNSAWGANSGAVQAQVNQALSADRLQSFLRSLMNPVVAKSLASSIYKVPLTPGSSSSPAPSDTTPVEVDPDLEYTSVEILASGIVLHGTLAVPPWPAPHVVFDRDLSVPHKQPQYRALNSWIPGGTVLQYQWHFPTATLTDSNRFVTINAPPLTLSDTTICLYLTGSRITAAGPVTYEGVSSPRACKMMGFPIGRAGSQIAKIGNRPQIVVPAPRDPGGPVEAVAHVSPWAPDGTAGGTANFVVYFPDNRAAGQLEFLTQALSQSERGDTETAIVCVLTPEQFSSARSVDGLLYADNPAPWEQMLGIQRRPAIAILNPAGDVVWRHEGQITEGGLAEALRSHLAAGGQFSPQFIASSLRIGEPSPNFLFETAPGQQFTLRKAAGQTVALVFFRGSAAPGIETIRNLHRAFAQPGVEPALIIAIDDGEAGEFARGLAAGEEGAIIVVPDPQRQVSRAYGVSVWPTTVFLDSDGLVQDIRLGLITEAELRTPVEDKPAQSNQPGGVS